MSCIFKRCHSGTWFQTFTILDSKMLWLSKGMTKMKKIVFNFLLNMFLYKHTLKYFSYHYFKKNKPCRVSGVQDTLCLVHICIRAVYCLIKCGISGGRAHMSTFLCLFFLHFHLSFVKFRLWPFTIRKKILETIKYNHSRCGQQQIQVSKSVFNTTQKKNESVKWSSAVHTCNAL